MFERINNQSINQIINDVEAIIF